MRGSILVWCLMFVLLLSSSGFANAQPVQHYTQDNTESCKGDVNCVIERIERLSPEIMQVCESDTNCIALIKAFMMIESDEARPHSVSYTGAAGLMQFIYSTAKESKYKETFPPQLLEVCCPTEYDNALKREGQQCGTDRNVCRKCPKGGHDCEKPTYTDPRFGAVNSITAAALKLLEEVRYPMVRQNIYYLAICYNAGCSHIPFIQARLGDDPPTLDNLADGNLLALAYQESGGLKGPRWTPEALQRKADVIINYYGPNVVKWYQHFGGQFVDPYGTLPEMILPGVVSLEAVRAANTQKGYQYVSIEESRLYDGKTYGFATPEDYVGALGTYTTYPGFRVVLPYNLKEYDLLQAQVQDLYGTCSGNVNLEECVQGKLLLFSTSLVEQQDRDDPGLVWTRGGCEQGDSAFAQEFIEQVSSCVYSEDSYCTCDLTFSGAYESTDLSVSFAQDDTLVYISDHEEKPRGELSMDMWFNGTISRTPIGKIRLRYDNGDYVLYRTPRSVDEEVLVNRFDVGFTVLKEDVSLIVSADGTFADVPTQCRPHKRTQTFCVRSSQLFHPDLVLGAGAKPLVYKFALHFPR